MNHLYKPYMTMNISTFGPAGYRFQDLACIELALRFINKDSIEMFIESGEDAKLSYKVGNIKKIVEVQIKQTRDEVSIEFLAEILAHFTAFTTHDFLLKRIVDNKNTSGLIIAGGRCSDDTRHYLGINWENISHENNFLKLVDVEKLKAALQDVKDGAVTLSTDRSAVVEKFLAQQPKTKLKQSLRKVFIEEQITEEKLISSCTKKLYELYRIPEEISSTVIIELMEKAAQIKKFPETEFISTLQSTARKYINRSKQKKYIPRGDEEKWNTSLYKNQILLLSGPPQCGKTYVAEYYKVLYEKKNYEIGRGTDVSAADRFLSMDVPQPRIFILEDPLGSISTESNAVDSLARIRGISDALDSDRKIIVTQRKDILLEVMGETQLEDCSIGSSNWFDLDTADTDFLTRAWQEFCDEAGVRQSISDVVKNILTSGESIEVGSLRRLANISDRLSESPTRHEIMQAARPDAKDIAAIFGKTQAGASLLSTFAFTTSPGVALGESELNFILDDDVNSELLGCRSKFDLGTFYGPTANEDEPPPTYPPSKKLNAQIQEQLDILEQRRFIEFFKNSYSYSHPFYRAVGQASTKSNIKSRKDYLIRNLKRAIYSLSATTSSTTIKNFDWILEQNKKDKEIVSAIVELAIEAFGSTLFVRTQQNCYRFLINFSSLLSLDQSKLMPEFSQRLSSISLSDIRWIGTEAAFYWGSSQDGMKQFLRSFGAEIDHSDTTSLLKRNYTKEQTADFVLGLARSPHLLTIDDVLTLLNYDESIIRAQAGKIWLQVQRLDDEKIVQKIFFDDQPNVFILSLQTVIECAHELSLERLDLIIKYVNIGLKSPLLASATLYRFDIFVDDSDEYYPESRRPENYDNRWLVFSKILPTLLTSVPDSVGVASSRFSDCLTETLKSNIAMEDKMSAINAWLHWMERKSNLGIPLDDWILRILDDVLGFFLPTNPHRFDILEKYSNLKGTAYCLVFIQEMSRHWSNLSASEFRLFFNVITLASADRDWKLATFLLNSSDELEDALTSLAHANDVSFEMDLSHEGRVYQLLIILLCRLAPEADRVGVRANNRTAWLSLLTENAANPESRYFEQAFEYLRSYDIELLNEILPQAHHINPSGVINALWRIEADLGGFWNSRGWEIIYGATAESEKENLVTLLLENVHSYIESFNELGICFGDELGDAIFMKCNDRVILNFMKEKVFSFADHADSTIRNEFRGLFEIMLDQMPIFPKTYSIIERHIKKLNYSWPEFCAKLKAKRLNAYNLATNERKAISLRTRLSLEDEMALGWVTK